MNSKKFGSRIKGFTLVEMIIVMAIIGILAGMISLFVGGFQRDARIEANNNKAQLVYTAFQNILINCEIEQDDSLFDMHDNTNIQGDRTIPLRQVVLCFGMSGAKVDDDMYLEMSWQSATSPSGSSPISRTNYSDWYKKIEKQVLAELDNSFEGTAVVYMDLENYVVDSVLYFELNAKSVSDLKASMSSNDIVSDLEGYADVYKSKNNTKINFQMLNSLADQKKFYKYVGSYLGAYPKFEDYDSNTAPTKVSGSGS